MSRDEVYARLARLTGYTREQIRDLTRRQQADILAEEAADVSFSTQAEYDKWMRSRQG